MKSYIKNVVFIIFIGVKDKKNFITPRQNPLLSEKSIKVGKKAVLIASVIAVVILCSG